MHPQPPRRTTHTAGGPRNLLVFDRWGQFGRPVVLLHGLLYDRAMWWPAAAELAGPGCTIVAPDLPGHGQSPARDDYRIERIARDLAALVNSLQLHRAPIIVGHGASALLATAFAESYATHALITLERPRFDAAGIEDLIGATAPEDVPLIFQPYLVRHEDPLVLRAYESWLAQPSTRRNEPAIAGRASSRPTARDEAFAHLVDPEGFADELRVLL